MFLDMRSSRDVGKLTTYSGKYNLPAYTLPVLGSKLYIALSPKLASSIFRSRTLSFDESRLAFMGQIVGAEGQALEIWKDSDFTGEFFKVLRRGLTGQSLASITATAYGNVAKSLNRLASDELDVDDLYIWAREIVAVAITTSFYGTKSPWKRPEVLQTFW